MSAIITGIREAVYRNMVTRYLCVLAMVLALLLYWLYLSDGEVSFVYNQF